jgi:hypothetical protein
VFLDVAQETMSIRSNNADLEIPDSIYEALADSSDGLAFNNSLLNSRTYNASVAGAQQPAPAYEESSNDRPYVGTAPDLPPLPNPQHIQQSPGLPQVSLPEAVHQSPVPHTQHVIGSPNVILSPAQPSEPAGVEPNLIDLSDHSPTTQAPASSHADDMGTLTLQSPFLAGSSGSYFGSYQLSTTEWHNSYNTDARHSYPLESHQSYNTDARHSYAPESHQTHGTEQNLAFRPCPSTSIPSDKIVIVEPEAEKIVVVPDDRAARYSTASSASLPRPSSTISDRNRTSSISGSDVLSPDSASSPSTERLPSPIDTMRPYMTFSLPAATTANVPPSDDVLEAILTRDMPTCLASENVLVRLDWAEEALRHVRVCEEYERRAAKTQRARAAVPVAEQSLKASATRLVEDLAAAGDARAVFLKARYLETERTKRLELHQTARRQGYMRSHYYLGLGLMEEKNKAALWHFETGSEYGDSACSYVRLSIIKP